ncbi:hypothetical protein K227x_07160 [Rubripirellula lacrimiformis]|uniref:Ice-binding protein C-terminal domain-containing protein n=1 Tax=Rubripirellula lacrimiformis TaxID=1930273 RepID=A0A517N5C4_9BACT|nr:choice-of-anchor M domain-containing protein [Rubripirellula lacrimiformis]QDT02340.1 hypothetical protein K227x_07160 [Rubripirellula lacrimiformis]
MNKFLQAFPILIAVLVLLLPRTASADVVTYTSGHGDIGLAYEGGELELHYHFGDGAILDGVSLIGDAEFDPAGAVVWVSDDARSTTTSSIAFLGTKAGDSVWRLPQSNTAGLPFLGIAAEELLPAEFSAATLQLTSFDGPGEFALWQSGGFGGADVFWQSNNGLDSSDLLPLTIGGHDHFNFGFTSEGVYDLGVTAVANLAAGGTVSDFGTLRFMVGDAAVAVPEPASFVAIAALGVTGWAVRRRRRRHARRR